MAPGCSDTNKRNTSYHYDDSQEETLNTSSWRRAHALDSFVGLDCRKAISGERLATSEKRRCNTYRWTRLRSIKIFPLHCRWVAFQPPFHSTRF